MAPCDRLAATRAAAGGLGRHGRGLRCAAYDRRPPGIIAGTAVVLLAVAAGVTVTLSAVPALREVLLAASAGYLLWLAQRIATTAPCPEHAAAPAKAPSLAGGLALAVASPKAWVTIAAVFSSARLAEAATADMVAKVAALTYRADPHGVADRRRIARPPAPRPAAVALLHS